MHLGLGDIKGVVAVDVFWGMGWFAVLAVPGSFRRIAPDLVGVVGSAETDCCGDPFLGDDALLKTKHLRCLGFVSQNRGDNSFAENKVLARSRVRFVKSRIAIVRWWEGALNFSNCD